MFVQSTTYSTPAKSPDILDWIIWNIFYISDLQSFFPCDIISTTLLWSLSLAWSMVDGDLLFKGSKYFTHRCPSLHKHCINVIKMPKCHPILNNGGTVTRYTSCVPRRWSMLAQEPSDNLHISGDPRWIHQSKPRLLNKLDFLISVPVPPAEASCKWFHFVLLLHKNRSAPNRACLIPAPPITTWNWVCIGDALRN